MKNPLVCARLAARRFVLAVALVGFGWGAAHAFAPGEIELAALPREGRVVYAAIRKGGPFAYSKDGSTFGNFEGRLPKKRRGYYREYTVETPGARNRIIIE